MGHEQFAEDMTDAAVRMAKTFGWCPSCGADLERGEGHSTYCDKREDSVPEVEPKRVQLPLITNSEIRAARSCQRKHQFAYVLRRRPKQTAEPLRFGSLFHTGLAAYWETPGSAEDKLFMAIDAMRKSKNPDAIDLVKAEELMIGYSAMWGANESLETVAVEKEFRAPIINPETHGRSRTRDLGGKVDAIVLKGGRHWLVEHKTTSEDIDIGSNYWKKISAIDSQISTYVVGARALGYAIEGCVYDVIRKPALRLLQATPVEDRKFTKAGLLYAKQREHDETLDEYRLRLREAICEAPSRYFARGEVVRLEADIDEFMQDTWMMTQIIHQSAKRGKAPRNPDACITYGTCAYFGVCSGEININDDDHFRTASDAHEELGHAE